MIEWQLEFLENPMIKLIRCSVWDKFVKFGPFWLKFELF